MKRARSLGDLERQVMEVLWAAPDDAGLSSREVLEQLGPNRERAYTTIKTVLDRLVDKTMVTRVRDGRRWRYLARASREGLSTDALQSVLGQIDDSDRSTALLHFLQSVDDSDRAELRRLLDQVESNASGA